MSFGHTNYTVFFSCLPFDLYVIAPKFSRTNDRVTNIHMELSILLTVRVQTVFIKEIEK